MAKERINDQASSDIEMIVEAVRAGEAIIPPTDENLSLPTLYSVLTEQLRAVHQERLAAKIAEYGSATTGLVGLYEVALITGN